MRVFVLADSQTVLAFALAGIKGRAVHSPEEIPAILETLDPKETGLVLITEALARENRQVIERMLLEPGGALILEIPDLTGPKTGRIGAAERLVSLLRR